MASAEEMLLDNGYEDVVIFKDFSYDDALVGVTSDNRAVYDYEKMVEWLQNSEGWSYEDCAEWIQYNTIRGASYMGCGAPIVMFPLIKLEEDKDG